MATKAQILDALAQLDHNDPGHWTDDGLPRTSVVQKIASAPEVKRSDIEAAAPNFVRNDPQAAADTSAKSEADIEADTKSGPAEAKAPVTAPVVDDGGNAEVDDVDTWPVDSRAAADAKVQAVADRVTAAKAALVAAHKEVAAAVKAHDAALAERNAKYPPLSAAENIKQYLASEQRKRTMYASQSVLDRSIAMRAKPVVVDGVAYPSSRRPQWKPPSER